MNPLKKKARGTMTVCQAKESGQNELIEEQRTV